MANENKITWYSLGVEEIVQRLETDIKKGLTEESVKASRRQYGSNVLEREKRLSVLAKVLKQFKNPLVAVLVLAGFVTLALGEMLDTMVIFIAVFINATIGFFQENKASKAFEKLNESQKKHAIVMRGGKKHTVLSEDLVVGDLVVLEAGAYVPADIRLVEQKNLLVNESVLTGEWVNVSKEVGVCEKDNPPITEQTNMAWMGSLVSAGYGLGVVVEVGEKTELGKIAASLATIEESPTPIKKNIKNIAQVLSLLTVIAIVIIFILGLSRGESVGQMLLVAIAVAVAMMPEGLPAAVTAVLAVGMEVILKKGGLVRNLLAAETLGSTTVILTDKTGTITEAKMKLASIFTMQSLSLEASSENPLLISGEDDKALLEMAVLSSDAFVERSEDDADELVVRGRPLEKAIVLAGLEAGISQEEIFAEQGRLDFLGFESRNRFAASLNEDKKNNSKTIFLSGSPEMLLDNATHVYRDGKAEKITDEIREEFNRIQEKKAGEGMRFTAIAYKKVDWTGIANGERKIDELKENLIFGGLLAFEDPIREDVRESIATAKGAGAKVIMITGDNAITATKIATEAGIIKAGETVLTGSDVEKMKDKELLKALREVKVFARVLPSQKLRISKILKKSGEVVAMTGDGINDAPALRNADIGVAVGSGTEVAKEASDLILLDNSFSTIVRAIEEGRRMMDNLKKIIGYLLSTSFSEIFVIGGAMAFGAPLPILPTQILWANIIEEGLMNFAFVFEPADKDVMKKNPRSKRMKNVFTAELRTMIITVGVVTGLLLTALYFFLLRLGLPIEEIRTIMFVALSIDSIFFAVSFKSLDKAIWDINPFSNKYLIVSWSLSALLLLVAIFFPPIQKILSLVPLTGIELLGLFFWGVLNLLTIEVAKYFIFEKKLNKLKV